MKKYMTQNIGTKNTNNRKHKNVVQGQLVKPT